MIRQLLLKARRGDQLRRIHLDHTFAQEELKEGAQSGELTRNRGLLFVLGVQLREPLADRDVIDLLDVELAARTSFRIGRREMIVELTEIDPVIAQRMLAHVALVAQMLEELFE